MKEVGVKQLSLKWIFIYVVLSTAALFSLFPFYWMFVMAANPNHVINSIPPALLPGDHLVKNFLNVISNVDFFGAMLNSFIVSFSATLGVLFISSLAGFAFAKLRFPYKNVLFVSILLTMMVPPQLGLIPQYYIITKLGWISDLRAVIVLGLLFPVGIFLMRQYIQESVPEELVEAAKIDGCTNFRIYWNVVIPIILPAFATLGIIHFTYIWGDYLWPVTVLRDQSSYTIQVALGALQTNAYYTDYGMILSATFWGTLPLIIVFLFFNRFFISSLTGGSIKS
jgi:cellobiose transport system permease protein